ncbi:MAG: hypothetical protein ACP6IQ_01830 [Candidatus Njordarchaeia archaeon]
MRHQVDYENILVNNTYLVHNVFEVCETPEEIRIINSLGEIIVSLPPNTKWEVKEGRIKGWDKKSQAWKIEPYGAV